MSEAPVEPDDLEPPPDDVHQAPVQPLRPLLPHVHSPRLTTPHAQGVPLNQSAQATHQTHRTPLPPRHPPQRPEVPPGHGPSRAWEVRDVDEPLLHAGLVCVCLQPCERPPQETPDDECSHGEGDAESLCAELNTREGGLVRAHVLHSPATRRLAPTSQSLQPLPECPQPHDVLHPHRRLATRQPLTPPPHCTPIHTTPLCS
mmetsp:Transcript_25126/g.72528  ORF Transcript_25126/g.72528 Transcript_25126/m.72528 type:complete len:202 (+) Transcript_25126:3116-3721(+)